MNETGNVEKDVTELFIYGARCRNRWKHVERRLKHSTPSAGLATISK